MKDKTCSICGHVLTLTTVLHWYNEEEGIGQYTCTKCQSVWERDFTTDFKQGDVICFKDEPDLWGIVTVFSNDGMFVYYAPRGRGMFRCCAETKLMKKCDAKNLKK